MAEVVWSFNFEEPLEKQCRHNMEVSGVTSGAKRAVYNYIEGQLARCKVRSIKSKSGRFLSQEEFADFWETLMLLGDFEFNDYRGRAHLQATALAEVSGEVIVLCPEERKFVECLEELLALARAKLCPKALV